MRCARRWRQSVCAASGRPDVSGCSRLVDPGIPPDISSRPRLVVSSIGVRSRITGSTGLIDAAIAGEQCARRTDKKHTDDQYGNPWLCSRGVLHRPILHVDGYMMLLLE